MKRLNKKGFTMAELLIVVAIIAVLVAIAIPVFTSQLTKARQATNAANLRAAYAEASSAYLLGDATGTTITLGEGTASKSGVMLTKDGVGDAELSFTVDSGASWGSATSAAATKVTFTWDASNKVTANFSVGTN